MSEKQTRSTTSDNEQVSRAAGLYTHINDLLDAQGAQGAGDPVGIPDQQAHVVAPFREGGDGVAADETRSPGHQNAHVTSRNADSGGGSASGRRAASRG